MGQGCLPRSLFWVVFAVPFKLDHMTVWEAPLYVHLHRGPVGIAEEYYKLDWDTTHMRPWA